jgi:hypothetical protein
MFRKFFLLGLMLSPDGDGAGGGDTGGAAAGGDTSTGAAAPADGGDQGQSYPTAAESRQAEADDILGGLPANYNVPRGTPETPATPTPAGDGTPTPLPDGEKPTPTPTPVPAPVDKPVETPTPPTYDFSKLAGGKYKDEASVATALTELETTRATLADPQVQAFVELAKDPVKANAFFRELGRDYATEAKSDPKSVLFEQYKADNPDYSEKGAKLRFDNLYAEKYPHLDVQDEEDPDYQNSVLLRDEDAAIAAKKRTAEQETKRAAMLADVSKLAITPEQPAAVVGLSEAEIQTHMSAADAAVKALAEAPIKVDVLDAQGNKVGEDTINMPVNNADAVRLFLEDTEAYLTQAGVVNDKGEMNYEAYREFGRRAINYQQDVQAAVQKGIEIGVKRGAAALIGEGANPTPTPVTTPIAAPGTPGAQVKTGYAAQQAEQAKNYPDF